MPGYGQLNAVSRTLDIPRVQQLFDDNVADSDAASQVLRNAKSDSSLYRCLLQNGADPYAAEIRMIRSIELLKVLAEFGYDFKSKGHVILQDHAADKTTLDWLLAQGVDINKTDTRRTEEGAPLTQGESENSLHILNNVAANGDIELFDYLVGRGADVSRSLALHSVSRCQDAAKSTAMLGHLIDKHGMDIDADNEPFRDFFHDEEDSGTPLQSAIHFENLAVFKELLKRGADINARAESGGDLLFKAIGHADFEGFLPALEPLLQAGADPDMGMANALREGNVEAAAILLQHGADLVPALEEARERVSKRLKSCERDQNDETEEDCSESEAERNDQSMLAMLEDWAKNTG